MKNYLFAFANIIAMALIFSGCTSSYYAQRGYDYYDYGDGPLYNDYYNQPTNQNYQAGITVNLSFNDFYTQLSPYGIWVEMAPYGKVWIAGVANFQPYSTNGYWAYTTYGWTWVSNYSWGWAPFHYGRWGHSNRYGWYWVPGYVWGPAWVAWSSGYEMYGWAPLMPGMNYHVNLSVRHFPSSYWTFMPGRYMGNTNIGGYYVNRSRNTTIIKNITIINNYGTENNRRYSMGPHVNEVQRYTGRSIQPMRVSNSSDSRSTGVSNDELRIYRPSTSSDNVSGRTSNDPTNNNRSNVTQQTRTQTGQPATNRSATQQTRSQTNQPENNRQATQQTRTQTDQPTNSRSATQQTRTQSDQPANNRSATPQARSQSDQPSNDRSATTQTREQLMKNRAAMQQSATTPEYNPNPVQPRVKNSAAPQTTRQIEAAQKDNTRTQQRSTATNQGRR